MRKKAKLIFILFAAPVLTVFLYIILHEFGHMIVMLSAGAKITKFSIFGAYVSAEGGSYTDYSEMWRHANGMLFPVLISYVYLLFYKSNSEKNFYRIFSFYAGLVPAASILAWIVTPVSFMSGNAPPGDDVSDFLFIFTKYGHPLFVGFAAVVFIGISVMLMVKKRVIHNYVEVVKGLR
jgi:hypothetical protein